LDNESNNGSTSQVFSTDVNPVVEHLQSSQVSHLVHVGVQVGIITQLSGVGVGVGDGVGVGVIIVSHLCSKHSHPHVSQV